jgi:exodeoxyribonuclease VII large subunit
MSGASGPTTTRSTARSRAKASNPDTSSAAIGTHSASSAMPALPGAAQSFVSSGDLDRAQARACSRPPPPTSRTFMRFSGAKAGGNRSPAAGP